MVKKNSLSEYLVKQQSSDEITLYRKMGWEEYDLWMDNKSQELMEKSKRYDYPTRVFHFSFLTPAEQTFSRNSEILLRFDVPKEVLIGWIERKQVWSGYLQDGDHVIDHLEYEFVIDHKLVEELYRFVVERPE